ncbi:hypothetical protein DFH09DRAFT_154319 [Mycena vulgaris]|nr:hypothetical protein DFH09DRAFT_154319 [Mycena vulgaris]
MATAYASLTRGVAIDISGVDATTPNPFVGANSQLAFCITSSIAFALILWEYASLLPDEIKLYRKPVWGTVPPYAFVALRYGGIVATLPTLFLSVAEATNCQAAASISQSGVILALISSAIIFAFHTSLLWTNNRIVPGILGGILVTMTICWIAVATQYKAVSVVTPPFGSNCRVLSMPPWSPLGNASSMLFFLTALIFSLLKMEYHHPRDSLVASRVYRTNLAYLIGANLTAATALIIQSLAPPNSALSLSTTPLATVFTVAFGTRAFRNLMLATILEAERAHGLPYPSTSPIISHASETRYAHPPPTRTSPSIASAQLQNYSRPRTAGSTESSHKNPYTSFPSPPNSYTNHSVLGSAHSQSPTSLSPLRRGAVRAIPEAPKSGWSDS